MTKPEPIEPTEGQVLAALRCFVECGLALREDDDLDRHIVRMALRAADAA